MNVKQISELIGLSENTIRRKIKELYPNKLEKGKKTRLNQNEVLEIVSDLRVKGEIEPIKNDDIITSPKWRAPRQNDEVDIYKRQDSLIVFKDIFKEQEEKYEQKLVQQREYFDNQLIQQRKSFEWQINNTIPTIINTSVEKTIAGVIPRFSNKIFLKPLSKKLVDKLKQGSPGRVLSQVIREQNEKTGESKEMLRGKLISEIHHRLGIEIKIDEKMSFIENIKEKNDVMENILQIAEELFDDNKKSIY